MSVYPAYGGYGQQVSVPQGPPQYEFQPQPQPYNHLPPLHQTALPQTMYHGVNHTTNLTVINQQPRPENRLVLVDLKGHRDWTSGLCGCCGDCGGCMMAYCCPTCVVMQVSAKLHENPCVAICIPCSIVTLRTRLRTIGGIEGSVCDDYCTFCCCGYCALCQMAREIEAMGL